MEKSSGPRGQYQMCKPVTEKNIGKNHLKHVDSKTYNQGGNRERERRLKRLAKQEREYND